ncbi:MAG: GntR family transcriptional regulator [Ktedonobacteraceae bacterium]|nr:GntR family transcriptional regulator [Ktedonobacteraceae bacterium]
MAHNPEKVNRVLDALRERINNGEYGRSGRLPSRLQLAKEFRTSAETINKAINVLRAEGLLMAQGRSVAVSPSPIRVPGMMESFARHVRSLGQEPLVEYLGEPERITFSKEEARLFGVPEGMEVVRRMRRQGTKTQPYRLLESFYPWELVGDELLQRMRAEPEFVLTEEIQARTGLFHTHIHERVITRYPTARERDLLHVLNQAPILEITRVGRADDGTIVLCSRIVWNGSLCELTYDYLNRPDQA